MEPCFLETGRIPLGNLEITGTRLGRGAAGSVYTHPNLMPGTCVKLYHQDGRRDHAAVHAAKITAMVRKPPEEIFADGNTRQTVQLAWPLGRVMDGSHRPVGFIMPVVDFARSWSVGALLNPRIRQSKGIPMGQRANLIVALNVARLLESLHAAGHFVIDLKPQNMRVYDTSIPARAGYVALLDCDGFAIRDSMGGAFYPAAMATAEYAHPAWHDPAKGIAWLNANGRQQDMWAAATLFFRLLNDNIHPMAGIPIGPDATKVPSSNPERIASA